MNSLIVPSSGGGVAAPVRKCRGASLAAQTGWSDILLSFAYRFSDRFYDRFRVFAENAIFKSENLQTFFLEVSRALCLEILAQNGVVPRAVEFNDQRTFRTVEIHNIWTNAVLAAELLTENLALLQVGPENCFRCSSFIAEFFSLFSLLRVVVDAAGAVTHAADRCNQRTSLTTPSAPLRSLRGILLMAQPPLLWRRGLIA
jgi:hypothetical protein